MPFEQTLEQTPVRSAPRARRFPNPKNKPLGEPAIGLTPKEPFELYGYDPQTLAMRSCPDRTVPWDGKTKPARCFAQTLGLQCGRAALTIA